MSYKLGKRLLKVGLYTSIFFFGAKCGRGCDGLEYVVGASGDAQSIRKSARQDIADPVLDYIIERTSGKKYTEQQGGK